MIRSTLQATLEGLGHSVLTAVDGEEGLELFRKAPSSIDLVILDMIMPRKNGRETFEELRTIKPDIRVLISSGFTRDEEVRTFRAKGNCDVIRKPYSREDLVSRINQLMNKSSTC